ncbi:UDP-glucose 4-epimerase GalE [Exiguobacterium sp. SH1S21]|uniref:UDP-glucose 4-epimerase GalE n=1 Tax=Exiguobacterium sp. SH1S21 TaxID=2510953 RepID=UPI001040CB45|nr:UDP-glucose 4-epimerase GalE [Exiguobacterium sp. SH1S21]TCI57432.1 UDP-glucose 4-epimerase GalE [Exiguobacterium sp. SH1S21]
MSVLVVGGAGYIGSHAVRALLARGEDVIVIDNLQTGHIESVPKQVRFYEGDIRDRAFMDETFANEEVTEVLHFAANSLVGESMEEPLAYYDNNVFGTQVLLETMRKHGVARIVFSSTAATYGDQDEMPIRETAETNPTNTYGATKLAMETMMKWCDRAFGIRFVALRYFNVAGADPSGEIGEDHTPETHLIPLVLEVANGQREAITVFGDDYNTPDGTCIRDYIHVQDLVDAHVRALDYLKRGGDSDVFNLGTETGLSVLEIIEAARRVTGHPIPVKTGTRRAGDPAMLIASPDKAKRVLGWTPERSTVDMILTDAWNWHESHPEGYKHVEGARR